MNKASPSLADQEMIASARLAAIVESSVDAIVSKQLNGIVTSWNRAAESIFGYSAEEMVGSSIYRLIPVELHQEETDILTRVAGGEPISHYETTRVRKDGRRIQISLTVSPVRDNAGNITGIASIKRDITESKQLEEVLRQAAKMEAIGRLAGGLAHDFNNHLHALSGFAHFISRDARLSPTSRQDLLQIQKVADRMASLTHQLLAFARQQVLSPEVLDISAIISEASPMLQRLVGSNYELIVSHGPGPRWVRADRSQLIQVLMNLVINGRDAMSQGGPITIRTDTREIAPGQLTDRNKVPVEPGAYAVLTVTDEGSGITPDDLQRIFEPFFTTKEIGRGTGLGLATVEGIVSQSNGYIQVSSEPGRGTTFTVLLPLIHGPSFGNEGSTTPAEGERWLGRIMVVDDDEYVRSVISRLLLLEGYEVISANTAEEALDCLRQSGGAVDLVITDVVMPQMSGPELARQVAAEFTAIPTILISGHPREPGRFENEDADVAFLQKPISPNMLLQMVQDAFARNR